MSVPAWGRDWVPVQLRAQLLAPVWQEVERAEEVAGPTVVGVGVREPAAVLAALGAAGPLVWAVLVVPLV